MTNFESSFTQMQDAECLNFGVLTDKEMDFMLNSNIMLLVPMTPISSVTTSWLQHTKIPFANCNNTYPMHILSLSFYCSFTLIIKNYFIVLLKWRLILLYIHRDLREQMQITDDVIERMSNVEIVEGRNCPGYCIVIQILIVI